MKTSALKKEIHQAIDDTKDNEILEAVHTILRKASKEEDEIVALSEKDVKELDRRWASYKSGKSKTSTVEEAKIVIRKKIKSAKR